MYYQIVINTGILLDEPIMRKNSFNKKEATYVLTRRALAFIVWYVWQ